jgi:uncharacterized membrane protein YfcA
MQKSCFFKISVIKKIILIVLGMFVGVANGLFGSGGGMIAVPALKYVSGLNQKNAQATAIAVILPVSIISALVYILGGKYDLMLGVYVGGGAIVGAVLGAFVLSKLSNKILSILFCLLMIAGGIKIICS